MGQSRPHLTRLEPAAAATPGRRQGACRFPGNRSTGVWRRPCVRPSIRPRPRPRHRARVGPVWGAGLRRVRGPSRLPAAAASPICRPSRPAAFHGEANPNRADDHASLIRRSKRRRRL